MDDFKREVLCLCCGRSMWVDPEWVDCTEFCSRVCEEWFELDEIERMKPRTDLGYAR